MLKQPLCQLAYISHTQCDMTAENIASIHQQAERNNKLQQITGLLLANEQYFLQLLEGPAIAVKIAYERIQLDRRHNNVQVIFQRQVAKRQFSDWYMGLHRSLDAAERQDVNTIINLYAKRTHYTAQQGEALILLLSALSAA